MAAMESRLSDGSPAYTGKHANSPNGKNAPTVRPQTILVIGASSGIGAAIAEKIADKPCNLILLARRTNLCDKIKKKILDNRDNKTVTVHVESLDVTQRDDVQAVFKKIVHEYGAIDVIVHVSGVMYYGFMKNQNYSEWDQQIDVNCKGVVNTCGCAVPYLIKTKGHLVVVSSDAARQTFPCLTVYNATKSFVHSFATSLRCELVGTGVRVTEIQPGDVKTDLVIKNTDKEAADKIGVKIGETISGDRDSCLDAVDVAQAVRFALRAPAYVGINEILIEPRSQMWGDPTSVGAPDDGDHHAGHGA